LVHRRGGRSGVTLGSQETRDYAVVDVADADVTDESRQLQQGLTVSTDCVLRAAAQGQSVEIIVNDALQSAHKRLSCSDCPTLQDAAPCGVLAGPRCRLCALAFCCAYRDMECEQCQGPGRTPLTCE